MCLMYAIVCIHMQSKWLLRNNPLLSCPFKILGGQEAFRDCWGWQCQSVRPIFWSRSWRVFPGGLSNHSYSALLLGTTGRWLAQSGCHPECVATAPCISLGRSTSRGFVWWPWDALSQYAVCVALCGLTGLKITSWGFCLGVLFKMNFDSSMLRLVSSLRREELGRVTLEHTGTTTARTRRKKLWTSEKRLSSTIPIHTLEIFWTSCTRATFMLYWTCLCLDIFAAP